jgi:hypothetical protein
VTARKAIRERKARPGSGAGDVCPVCRTMILAGQRVTAARFTRWKHTGCYLSRRTAP